MKIEEKLGIIDTTMKTDDEPSRKEPSKSLKQVALDAWLITNDSTLDRVAKKLVEAFSMKKQASTILSCYRELLRLDSRFRLDCRGVHEREWIYSELDKQENIDSQWIIEKMWKEQNARNIIDMKPGFLNNL